MPTEIGLADGTKFRVVDTLDDVLEFLAPQGVPEPGLSYIRQEGELEMHFNPAQVTYVRNVPELTPAIAFVS